MKIMMNDHWSRKTAMNTCLIWSLIIVNNSMNKHEKDRSCKYHVWNRNQLIIIMSFAYDVKKNHTMKCLVHKWSVLINVPFMTPTPCIQFRQIFHFYNTVKIKSPPLKRNGVFSGKYSLITDNVQLCRFLQMPDFFSLLQAISEK